MAMMRSALLAGAESVWLREKAMRYRFVRRSVSRFMPGESMDEALEASRRQERDRGTGTILTHLGENLTSPAEAEVVTAHYLQLIDRIAAGGLNAQISVKLTQLGLDLGMDGCLKNLSQLVERSDSHRNMVWIDMESTPYVDRTLQVFRKMRERSTRVGVCLQAYLRRSQSDLEALLPLAPAIRVVKGAYREPPSLAFPGKADVDENYFRLASRLVQGDVKPGTFLGIGTHDERLIERIRGVIRERQAAPSGHEFEMLYGIRRPLQGRLVAEQAPVRVLISYGEFWFPWYMRRLAERPANVLFVARSMFGG
jgi:proline dehydrogenase